MNFRPIRCLAPLVCAALIAAPAFAQQQPSPLPRLVLPQPTVPAAPAPTPLPAQAPAAPQAAAGSIPIPNATPSHLAAAREVVMSSGVSRSFEGAIPTMARQINATVTRTRPELAGDMKASLDALQPEFVKLTEDMIVNATRIYTALLTEQECKDVAAFFKSPIGVKFIDVQPVVYGNLADVMEAWTKHLAQTMYEMTRDEMKKKGHQI